MVATGCRTPISTRAPSPLRRVCARRLPRSTAWEKSRSAAAQSDVDVLVEFEPRLMPGFFDLFKMEEELSGLFGGRKVDIRTPQDLSRYFRDEVMKAAEVQYAAE